MHESYGIRSIARDRQSFGTRKTDNPSKKEKSTIKRWQHVTVKTYLPNTMAAEKNRDNFTLWTPFSDYLKTTKE